jgi:hypothetical protein
MFKGWLLPLGILATSALVAFGIVAFGPFSLVRSSDEEVAQQAASEPAGDCSGALSGDYACHQERYRHLGYFGARRLAPGGAS